MQHARVGTSSSLQCIPTHLGRSLYSCRRTSRAASKDGDGCKQDDAHDARTSDNPIKPAADAVNHEHGVAQRQVAHGCRCQAVACVAAVALHVEEIDVVCYAHGASVALVVGCVADGGVEQHHHSIHKCIVARALEVEARQHGVGRVALHGSMVDGHGDVCRR